MQLVAFWLSVTLGPVGAQSDPLASLDVGANLTLVKSALARRGVTRPMILEREVPQTLATALVDSGLLEAINGGGCTPRDRDGALSLAAFKRFMLGRRPGARYAVSFSERRGLSFMLARLNVPVDARADPRDGWSVQRLRRVRRALSSLAPYRPHPDKPDAYGNVFSWTGRSRRGVVRVRYRPERDELWVLLAPRQACRSRR